MGFLPSIQIFRPISIALAASMSTSGAGPARVLEVAQFPCLNDNYGYLVHSPATGETAAIDTPCASSYKAELERRGWKLTHIFNTHHHWDHTGANLELKKEQGAKIYASKKEECNTPGIDLGLEAGQEFEFGSTKVQVIDVGGHTNGHIAYYFGSDGNSKVFCGDALFVMGCGRMFEGTPEQFWGSLKRLSQLPDETKVYCAHEYTLSNAKFAMSVEPNNPDLAKKYEEVKKLRANGVPTVPSTIGEEKKTNPFLRVALSDEIRRNVGVNEGDSEANAFAKVRRAKDIF